MEKLARKEHSQRQPPPLAHRLGCYNLHPGGGFAHAPPDLHPLTGGGWYFGVVGGRGEGADKTLLCLFSSTPVIW